MRPKPCRFGADPFSDGPHNGLRRLKETSTINRPKSNGILLMRTSVRMSTSGRCTPMKHIVAGLSSFALFVLVSAAVAQTDTWKEYVYTGDGFAIAAPAEPARNSQPIYVTGGTADAHIYTSAANSNTALMLFVYERHSKDKRSLQQIHAQAQEDALGSVNGKMRTAIGAGARQVSRRRARVRSSTSRAGHEDASSAQPILRGRTQDVSPVGDRADRRALPHRCRSLVQIIPTHHGRGSLIAGSDLSSGLGDASSSHRPCCRHHGARMPAHRRSYPPIISAAPSELMSTPPLGRVVGEADAEQKPATDGWTVTGGGGRWMITGGGWRSKMTFGGSTR